MWTVCGRVLGVGEVMGGATEEGELSVNAGFLFPPYYRAVRLEEERSSSRHVLDVIRAIRDSPVLSSGSSSLGPRRDREAPSA